jgi:hypothetical protein
MPRHSVINIAMVMPHRIKVFILYINHDVTVISHPLKLSTNPIKLHIVLHNASHYAKTTTPGKNAGSLKHL